MERTLQVAVVVASGALEALGRTVSRGGVADRGTERLGVDKTGTVVRLEHTHLALYREGDLLALGYHHRCPPIPLQRQEEDPQA